MNKRISRITIPFSPDTINSTIRFGQGNHVAVTNLKLKWQDFAERYFTDAMHSGLLPDRFMFPISVAFHLYFETIRTRDQDNYYVMTKGIIDALTSLRMIHDDADGFVDFGGINFHKEPDRPRVEVAISERFPFNVDDKNGVLIKDYYSYGEPS